jgi:NAD(P)-dependent dehydrogenase (short-subunit alcohol dehydrogenase family)
MKKWVFKEIAMGRLEGKVAIVTGSNGSIGGAISKAFLMEGASVVFTEYRTKGAEIVARSTNVSEEKWMVHSLDATDRHSVRFLVKDTVKHFGKLDIMVAHAGSMLRKPFLETHDDDFDWMINNNLKSAFMCCQEAAKVMAESGKGGSIICTSSISAIIARKNCVLYGTTKGAISSMVRNIAYDLAPFNIRVNCIVPGTIETNQNRERLSNPQERQINTDAVPLHKIGDPEDMVGAYLFLASDESSYATGTEIVVDGGRIIA